MGTLVGALIGMGIPEYEAKRYEGRVKNGGILLSVHCDNSEWVDKAKHILKGTGAEDIASAGEKGASTHGIEKTTGKPIQTDDTYTQREREKLTCRHRHKMRRDPDGKISDADEPYTPRGHEQSIYAVCFPAT